MRASSPTYPPPPPRLLAPPPRRRERERAAAVTCATPAPPLQGTRTNANVHVLRHEDSGLRLQIPGQFSYIYAVLLISAPTTMPIDLLPNEILALILKLVVDLPISDQDVVLPAPVIASHVSRRWRAVVLASPKLWATIRISYRERDRDWAALCVKRSHPYPLDISVNLESYTPWPVPRHSRSSPDPELEYGYPAPLPLHEVLAILGPHIERWRTFALRGWADQLNKFCKFVAESHLPASQLESAHFFAVGGYGRQPSLDQLSASVSLRSLRINTTLQPTDLVAFRSLRLLDIDYVEMGGATTLKSPEFRHLLTHPSCALTTLIIRHLGPFGTSYGAPSDLEPILAPGLQSIAIICTWAERWAYRADNTALAWLTRGFSLPNLTHLEIAGGVDTEEPLEVGDHNVGPLDSSAARALFPLLRTLRLENVALTSASALSLIQGLSSTITTLQLVDAPVDLLANPAAWPDLRTLAVGDREMEVGGARAWIQPFLASRVPAPTLMLPHLGSLVGLIDGPGTFFVAEETRRPTDFAWVWVPMYPPCCCWDPSDWYATTWGLSEAEKHKLALEAELERVEEDIWAHLKGAEERATLTAIFRLDATAFIIPPQISIGGSLTDSQSALPTTNSIEPAKHLMHNNNDDVPRIVEASTHAAPCLSDGEVNKPIEDTDFIKVDARAMIMMHFSGSSTISSLRHTEPGPSWPVSITPHP
ncbi:hypothetical protein C8R46DRAFT_1353388 [Mycena filopes]|nr:hypothetical protein C8R46DRAFT_1353388 [Mycena filopes]